MWNRWHDCPETRTARASPAAGRWAGHLRVHGLQRRYPGRRGRRPLRLDRVVQPGRIAHLPGRLVSHRRRRRTDQVGLPGGHHPAGTVSRRLRLRQGPPRRRLPAAHQLQARRGRGIPGPGRTRRRQHRQPVRPRVPRSTGGRLVRAVHDRLRAGQRERTGRLARARRFGRRPGRRLDRDGVRRLRLVGRTRGPGVRRPGRQLQRHLRQVHRHPQQSQHRRIRARRPVQAERDGQRLRLRHQLLQHRHRRTLW
ncbi:MAG: hypothetical protein BWX88_04889 [Planctomycetes bacterium ADurb.Bin126]|nr:MAG: hypothetical protein BWX88_04889 [Planctomycetes bacterium ADurb.Bin126]